MCLPAADAAAARRADRHRREKIPRRAEAQARKLADDLIEDGINIVV